jgi:hypothetical protein
MSLCKNEKNIKRGDGQKNKQKTCPPCMRMKISKRGDRQKNPSYPCMKMKISNRGTDKKGKKKRKKHVLPV